MKALILVSVPRNATFSTDCGTGLAFGIGPGRKKIATRLIAPDPCSYKGRKVVCEAETRHDRKNNRPKILLKPTNRRHPTHDCVPIVKGQSVEFAALT